ncbi:holo-ACP synthase [Limosilactobacillus ingluviei]|uniref:holo-ACP synthase n=1 Tax=Limosilactobacillus ingluviei TaxID=148604 RepID=UPI0023F3EA4E|nr:holo-ACP synthase [Limosilactobacillus ingluviei]
MIVGTGTDIQDLAPIERALARNDQFLKRVLTPQEQAQAHQLHGQRLVEYVGGRWATKEAFSKAWGTGIGKQVGFQDIEVLNNAQGKPEVTRSPHPGPVWVSISHTKALALSFVILERSENA